MPHLQSTTFLLLFTKYHILTIFSNYHIFNIFTKCDILPYLLSILPFLRYSLPSAFAFFHHSVVLRASNPGKQADEIQRRVRQLESKCMNNEANIEDLEKLLHEAKSMYQDSDKKLDESTRRLVRNKGTVGGEEKRKKNQITKNLISIW